MFTRVWERLAEGRGHPGGTPVTVVGVAYFDAASTEPLHPAARDPKLQDALLAHCAALSGVTWPAA